MQAFIIMDLKDKKCTNKLILKVFVEQPWLQRICEIVFKTHFSLLEMSRNGWKLLKSEDMTGKCLKWMKIAGNSWKYMKLLKRLDMNRKGWGWLKWL